MSEPAENRRVPLQKRPRFRTHFNSQGTSIYNCSQTFTYNEESDSRASSSPAGSEGRVKVTHTRTHSHVQTHTHHVPSESRLLPGQDSCLLFMTRRLLPGACKPLERSEFASRFGFQRRRPFHRFLENSGHGFCLFRKLPLKVPPWNPHIYLLPCQMGIFGHKNLRRLCLGSTKCFPQCFYQLGGQGSTAHLSLCSSARGKGKGRLCF